MSITMSREPIRVTLTGMTHSSFCKSTSTISGTVNISGTCTSAVFTYLRTSREVLNVAATTIRAAFTVSPDCPRHQSTGMSGENSWATGSIHPRQLSL